MFSTASTFVSSFCVVVVLLFACFGNVKSYGVSECRQPMTRGPTVSYCCLRKYRMQMQTLASILGISRNKILAPNVDAIEVGFCAGLCRSSDPNWEHLIPSNMTQWTQVMHNSISELSTKCISVGQRVDQVIIYLDEHGDARSRTIHGLHATSCGCAA